MWGEPRKGTEADLVKREAERRKKIAKEKGLDRLVVDVYHDCIKYYPSWIKDNKNEKWVYPQIIEAYDVKSKSGEGVEFKSADKNYKIIRSDRHCSGFNDNYWCDLTLFLNDKRVFEVTEEEILNEYSDDYNPIFINAYVNDDWVNDFNDILSHKKFMDEQSSIDYAEDPKRTRELMESFGIDKVENIDKTIDKNVNKESNLWANGCFWVIVITVLIILASL